MRCVRLLPIFIQNAWPLGPNPRIMGSCSTGYGEDLIKAAFSLNTGIIETIAHYLAAKKINDKVSFILDIGGQDMKAIFVDHGVLNRMELNDPVRPAAGPFSRLLPRASTTASVNLRTSPARPSIPAIWERAARSL